MQLLKQKGFIALQRQTIRQISGAAVKNKALIGLVCVVLSGCASLMLPPVNQTERGVSQYIQDKSNTKKILDTLYQVDPRFKYARIEPNVFMGVLLLTGQVPDAHMAQLAIEAIQQQSSVNGISLIHNYLSIDEQPSYQQIAQDDYIVSTVKKGVYSLADVSERSVFITAEKAVLYVMGRVTEANTKSIVALAQQTPGVKKVVMLVDIVKVQQVVPVSKTIPVSNNSSYTTPAASSQSSYPYTVAPTISTQSFIEARQTAQGLATPSTSNAGSAVMVYPAATDYTYSNNTSPDNQLRLDSGQ